MGFTYTWRTDKDQVAAIVDKAKVQQLIYLAFGDAGLMPVVAKLRHPLNNPHNHAVYSILANSNRLAQVGATNYQYDANGNVHRISYDLLNRKTGESWDGAPDLTIAYAYDNCANGIGKLCQITDKSGSTSFAYDSKGQIAQKTQNIDGVELSKTYAYDSAGKLISETYPSGAQISYGYNVDKISSINGNPYITDIRYNAANQITGWYWSDGTSYSKTYDANGRLKSFPLGDKTRTLAYDANGNITGWTDQPTAGSAGLNTGADEAKTFAYDALNRLTDYQKADDKDTLESQLFSYDANGNRLKLENDGVQTVYSILANSNRLTQVGATNYQYDNNGNIINDGEHSYSYDSRNRLIGVDGASSYLYNANNMRVKKTTPAGAVLYGWDNDRIFAEYDQNGNAIQETVYFGSTPVALLKDGNIYRIYANQIDTPRVLTDNANTALWAWDSKPFGETQPDEDVDKDGASLSYNLRFPGQYYDAETGKHYNFNRDYNPVTGRYVQSDPIGLDGGVNGYLYAKNNTLLNADPRGEAICGGICIAAGAIIARVAYVGYRSYKVYRAYKLYRAGKLTHVFGQARHKLDGLVRLFGSREKAYDAVQGAIEAVVKNKNITGQFEQVVRVGGQNVTVRGIVQDGVTKIGTFFIK